ncbi:MAG TPA: aconitate hydratase, partial [Clostridia bacterium]|nr:aconitate hydratase [Clostridia bacterium]
FSSMRSNIPLIAQYAFSRYDPGFVARAKEYGVSVIVGGENYGQGSSREHAAITPMFLGVRAVLAKSMARIHKNNLVNHGVIPMLFEDAADYERINAGDRLEIDGLPEQLLRGSVVVRDTDTNAVIRARLELSEEEKAILLRGGKLAFMKNQLAHGQPDHNTNQQGGNIE